MLKALTVRINIADMKAICKYDLALIKITITMKMHRVSLEAYQDNSGSVDYTRAQTKYTYINIF